MKTKKNNTTSTKIVRNFTMGLVILSLVGRLRINCQSLTLVQGDSKIIPSIPVQNLALKSNGNEALISSFVRGLGSMTFARAGTANTVEYNDATSSFTTMKINSKMEEMEVSQVSVSVGVGKIITNANWFKDDRVLVFSSNNLLVSDVKAVGYQGTVLGNYQEKAGEAISGYTRTGFDACFYEESTGNLFYSLKGDKSIYKFEHDGSSASSQTVIDFATAEEILTVLMKKDKSSGSSRLFLGRDKARISLIDYSGGSLSWSADEYGGADDNPIFGFGQSSTAPEKAIHSLETAYQQEHFYVIDTTNNGVKLSSSDQQASGETLTVFYDGIQNVPGSQLFVILFAGGTNDQVLRVTDISSISASNTPDISFTDVTAEFLNQSPSVSIFGLKIIEAGQDIVYLLYGKNGSDGVVIKAWEAECGDSVCAACSTPNTPSTCIQCSLPGLCPAVECDSNCSETQCTRKNDPSSCYSCKQDYSPESAYPSICLPVCYEGCQVCSEPMNPHKCSSCISGYEEFFSALGQGECRISCDESCGRCSLPLDPAKCTSCKDGLAIIGSSQEGRCVNIPQGVKDLVGRRDILDTCPSGEVIVDQLCSSCTRLEDSCNKVLRVSATTDSIDMLQPAITIQFNRELEEILTSQDYANFPYSEYLKITSRTQADINQGYPGTPLGSTSSYNPLQFGVRITFQNPEFLSGVKHLVIETQETTTVKGIFTRNKIQRKSDRSVIEINLREDSKTDIALWDISSSIAEFLQTIRFAEITAAIAIIGMAFKQIFLAVILSRLFSKSRALKTSYFDTGKSFGSFEEIFRYFSLVEVFCNLEKLNFRFSGKIRSLFNIAKALKLPELGEEDTMEDRDYILFRKGGREKVLSTTAGAFTLFDIAMVLVPLYITFCILIYVINWFVKQSTLGFRILIIMKNILFGLIFMKYQFITMAEIETEYVSEYRSVASKSSFLTSVLFLFILTVEHSLAFNTLTFKRSKRQVEDLQLNRPNDFLLFSFFTVELSEESKCKPSKIVFYNRMKYFGIHMAIIYLQVTKKIQFLVCLLLQFFYLGYFLVVTLTQKTFSSTAFYCKILLEELLLMITLTVTYIVAMAHSDFEGGSFHKFLDWVLFLSLLSFLLLQIISMLVIVVLKIVQEIKSYLRHKKNQREVKKFNSSLDHKMKYDLKEFSSLDGDQVDSKMGSIRVGKEGHIKKMNDDMRGMLMSKGIGVQRKSKSQSKGTIAGHNELDFEKEKMLSKGNKAKDKATGILKKD